MAMIDEEEEISNKIRLYKLSKLVIVYMYIYMTRNNTKVIVVNIQMYL